MMHATNNSMQELEEVNRALLPGLAVVVTSVLFSNSLPALVYIGYPK